MKGLVKYKSNEEFQAVPMTNKEYSAWLNDGLAKLTAAPLIKTEKVLAGYFVVDSKGTPNEHCSWVAKKEFESTCTKVVTADQWASEEKQKATASTKKPLTFRAALPAFEYVADENVERIKELEMILKCGASFNLSLTDKELVRNVSKIIGDHIMFKSCSHSHLGQAHHGYLEAVGAISEHLRERYVLIPKDQINGVMGIKQGDKVIKLTASNIFDYICPNCKQDYVGLTMESSIELGQSRIKCSECVYSFQGECSEEDLIDRFNDQLTGKE